MRTMKAAVMHDAGGPAVLKIESLPIPTPKPGEVQIGKTFHLDNIVEAHRCMEENQAGGKIVVLT